MIIHIIGYVAIVCYSVHSQLIEVLAHRGQTRAGLRGHLPLVGKLDMTMTLMTRTVKKLLLLFKFRVF